MAKRRDSNRSVEPEGYEEFVRDNATAIVRRLEAKIERQRAALARLNKANSSLRRQLRSENNLDGTAAELMHALIVLKAADHAIASVLAVRDGISDGSLQGLRTAICSVLDRCAGARGADGVEDVCLHDWLETTFSDAVKDDERITEAAAVLKVAHEKGDVPIEAVRKTIAAFVVELIDPGALDSPSTLDS